MHIFTGSGVAIVTPFNEDFSINFEKLYELLDFHIENSTDAIVIGGTTGETATMTFEEHVELVEKCCAYVNKRIPVIAGSGSNSTAKAVELSRKCQEVGADGLLVVTPYYNKGNREGIIRHFKAIAESVTIPIILYNVPSRTGVNLAIDVVVELSKVQNIVGIKEASGNISYVAAILKNTDKDFAVYSGNDDMIVPLLSLGGVGVISVLANIMPKETHDMVDLYLKGDTDASRDLQLKLLDLVDSLFIEVNPIPVKTALNFMGFNVGPLRLPLYYMSENAAKVLKKEMNKSGLKISL